MKNHCCWCFLPAKDNLILTAGRECSGVMKLFNRFEWQAELAGDASLLHQCKLMARQGVSGKDN